MTVWPGNGLYIPKTVEGDKLDAAKKFVEFMTTQPGCDAYAKGTPPTGPFLTTNCKLPADVTQVAKDTQTYLESGKASPALEFKSPIRVSVPWRYPHPGRPAPARSRARRALLSTTRMSRSRRSNWACPAWSDVALSLSRRHTLRQAQRALRQPPRLLVTRNISCCRSEPGPAAGLQERASLW